jgi:hypothetical protein
MTLTAVIDQSHCAWSSTDARTQIILPNDKRNVNFISETCGELVPASISFIALPKTILPCSAQALNREASSTLQAQPIFLRQYRPQII